ncbi:MAG TPA: TadE/TadG family type IV pilus assembly protein [Pirellulales bacterium]|jgi:Flp pilus assembly protein TadG|nr:TadE/TadG family type IV pilus assembly protein [Pirellulales bacterium]
MSLLSLAQDNGCAGASHTLLARLSKKRVCRRPLRDRRRGTAAVEFALVAPLFVLLVFGMIEYGRMVMVQQLLVNAAREGARVGVLDGSTQTSVTTAVNNYLSPAGITTATVTVVPSTPSSAAATAPVTVTVSVPFNNVSWLPSPMYLGGKTLSFSAVMRRETMP